MSGMGSHERPIRGASDIWLTPRYILDALGEFDLDPCSSPDPQFWPTARNYITLPSDGLSEPWFGRVWLNPPYGQQTWRWVERLADHGCGIALTFARTEVKGFVAQVWNRADAILFLDKRLTFHRPDGTPGATGSGAPSCLIAYGQRDAEILAASGISGALVDNVRMVA